MIVRGDSVTAITWAEKELFHSWRATNAATVFSLEATAGRLDCAAEHILAELNQKTDKLSRRAEWGPGETMRAVVDGFGEGYVGVPIIDLERDASVCKLRDLCRPAAAAGDASDSQFKSLWKATSTVVRALETRKDEVLTRSS